MNRLAATAGAGLCLAITTAIGWAPATAAAKTPAHTTPSKPVTAWWTATSPGHGVPGLPGSPDVSGHQLLVQGSNAVPSLSLLGSAPTSSQAVSAVRWTLPAGRRAASVQVKLAGQAPPAVSIEACQITSSFKPVSGGPYSQVPSFTCAHAVDASLKGSTVTFTGVGRLAKHHVLSILLVPGPLDRVVIAPPSASALTLAKPTAKTPKPTKPTTPPTSSGGGSQAGSGGSGPASSTPTGGGSGGFTAPAPPGNSSVAAPPAKGQPPQVAGSGSGTSAPSTASNPAADVLPAPGWRRVVAWLVIAAEVLGFALLQLRRKQPVLVDGAGGRGIGRFVRERDSQPISL
jgi:hypothetical protein